MMSYTTTGSSNTNAVLATAPQTRCSCSIQTNQTTSLSQEHYEAEQQSLVNDSDYDPEAIAAHIQTELQSIRTCLAKVEIGIQNRDNVRRIKESGDFSMFEGCESREDCEDVLFARGLRTIIDGDEIHYTVATDELDEECDPDFSL